MKNILLPTDFSETAHHAFEYALHLAETLEARITLAYIYPKFPLEWNYAVPPVTDVLDAERVEDALQRFESYQREAQLRLGKQIPIQLLIEPGDPVTEIVRLSRLPKVDLIIMGTRGAGSEAENVFGSITAAVIQRSFAPVLAIPAACTFRPVRHLMYATTFETEDLSLMDDLLEFARFFGAHISCVHVEASQKAWYQMEFKFIERIYNHKSHWHLLRFFSFNHSDIQAGLNQFIQDTDVAIAAILTHRKGIFDRLLGKSFSKELVLHTQIPLLLFPTDPR